MIGKKCRHKKFGCIGKITRELKNDWGIYWFNSNSKFIRDKGLLNFWHDKNNIELKDN